MKVIGIISLTVLISSCTGLFDQKITFSEMKVNIQNNSDLTIKKAAFYINYNGKFADSTLVENITIGNSSNFVIKESNKIGGDGDFQLILTFGNGAVKKTGCCYFSNGNFLTSTIDFEVKKDTIFQKSTFNKYN